ncbi:MAG: TOBE domain-containing protein, partial [Ilumatobacteraceae bacterium]
LSNLDAKLRGETRAELVALHRRLQSTFVYVTHDQVEAMTMGSRIAVMNDGRLQQVGTPQDVYERPQTVFVAQFIGTPPMNILPAGLLGDPAVVGVRPEHVELTPGGALMATVRLVEQLGHETLVMCELNGDVSTPPTQLVARLTAEQVAPRLADDVLIDLPERHRHRFDAVTGERLA